MQEKARRVWVFANNDYYLGTIIKEEGLKYQVELPDTTIVTTTKIFRCNPSKFDLVEDLASLSHLNEPSVLNVLKNRYQLNQIYTYSGLFLVAINPYKELDIYSKKYTEMYSKNDSTLPPHIYKTVNDAYINMLVNKCNQSILITGESGAGKTENTKKAISFLLSLNKENGLTERIITEKVLTERIIKANIILESFGNAMTLRNDNSSRFGKFIQLNFESGNLIGCRIEKYLFEKSRLVKTTEQERNYHIFYQLLRSGNKELLKELNLTENLKDYKILNNFTDLNDKKMFEGLVEAFGCFNFKKDEIFNLFKIVSVVLHLGNLEFYDVTTDDDNTVNNNNKTTKNCDVRVKNMEIINETCEMLNIPIHKFLKCLLNPTISAGKESVVIKHSIKQCKRILESIIKVLYDWLFDSVINLLNRALNSNSKFENFIGILDIAGFEIFPFNSFEQLCINYTNEKLQQFFNHHMFILEQEIYKKEQINWDYIDFGLDLKPTIDTINELFNLLDDNCFMGGSDDQTFLLSLKTKFKNESYLYFNKIVDNNFKVVHYAGAVEYNIRDWLVKNNDPYFLEILELLNLDMKDKLTTKGFFRTTSQLYKNQLELLMNKLRRTNPFFVRCLIPNVNKEKNSLENILVLNQLKCNGVLEGIRITRLGYPSRMKYEEFTKRYKIILRDQSYYNQLEINNKDQLTKEILNTLNIKEEVYKFGKTMIFFKQDILGFIEEIRENKVNAFFNELNNKLKVLGSRLKLNKSITRNRSIRLIQSNSLLSNDFRRWKWWYLYIKIKPLLKINQIDDLIQLKEKELNNLKSQLLKNEKLNSLISDENLNLKENLLEKDKLNESINHLIKELKNDLENKNIKLNNLIWELENKEIKINDLNLILESEIKNKEIINKKELEIENNLKIINENMKTIDENKKLLISYKTEIENNNKYNKNKTEEIINLKDDEINKLKYENEILKENLIILDKIKKENNTLLNKNTLLIEENYNFGIEKGSLNSENLKLKEKIKEYLDLEKEFKNQRVELDLLNKEIEKNNEKIEELEFVVEKNKKLGLELIQYKRNNIDLIDENIKLKDKNRELENNINTIDENQLRSTIEGLNKKLNKERKINNQIEKENEELREMVNEKILKKRVEEIENLKRSYEEIIKGLELKLASMYLNIKDESESSEERLNVLLEEEKKKCLELELMLTEQENKNIILEGKLKSNEYELIDKFNGLEKRVLNNKERYSTLLKSITDYFNNIDLIEEHSLCNKKINSILSEIENDKHYFNNKILSLTTKLNNSEQEFSLLLKENKEIKNKLKEKEINLNVKGNKVEKLEDRIDELMRESMVIKKKVEDVEGMEVRNRRQERRIKELEKMVNFYKPFASLK